MSFRVLQEKTFVALVIAVSLAFAWILLPFYGAIFWATVLAILFAPLSRRLSVLMGRRQTLAAFATSSVIVLIVFLPASLVVASLAREAAGAYERVQSGGMELGHSLQRLFDLLPPWIVDLLDRFGVNDLASVQARLSAGLLQSSRYLATQAVNVGQNTFEFVVNVFIMLYLLFFLLRDGGQLARRAKAAIPLPEDLQRNLFGKLAVVIRAMIKGSVVVAIVQGVLGGAMFWFLGIHAPVMWGVVMGFLSLVPAVGTGLVWGPVAIYLLVTGAVWQGIVLIAFGVLVIGMVDNVLRPTLVGKDTRMPDYLVLISTLGGISAFGINGFVIGPVIAAMFVAIWDVVAASKAAGTRSPL
ncbi:MAG: AI-2E family transporter [Burkholderiaceae bacterium]|nr:AI-2E family transporter [Burkholderiaceae bacterium]